MPSATLDLHQPCCAAYRKKLRMLLPSACREPRLQPRWASRSKYVSIWPMVTSPTDRTRDGSDAKNQRMRSSRVAIVTGESPRSMRMYTVNPSISQPDTSVEQAPQPCGADASTLALDRLRRR